MECLRIGFCNLTCLGVGKHIVHLMVTKCLLMFKWWIALCTITIPCVPLFSSTCLDSRRGAINGQWGLMAINHPFKFMEINGDKWSVLVKCCMSHGLVNYWYTLFPKRNATSKLAGGTQFRDFPVTTCTQTSYGCARTMRNFGIGSLENCYQEHSTHLCLAWLKSTGVCVTPSIVHWEFHLWKVCWIVHKKMMKIYFDMQLLKK